MDLQLTVYVKDAVKIDWDDDRDEDLDKTPAELEDPVVEEPETEIKVSELTPKTGKKRKKGIKVKKTDLMSKTKSQKQKSPSDGKIITIELSYEEMLAEREKDGTKESYVKAQYKCTTCLIGFNYIKSYETHMKNKHSSGHGEYSELDGEKEFFGVCNKSDNVVCHFYKCDSPRCKIVDMHLKILAKKHVETRFVKLDAERAPFLAGRLKIRVIPTIALVKQNKTKDFIVGFTDLGNRDDFSTETLEWRIARSDLIEYSGDLTVPPEEARAQRKLHIQSKKTVRGRQDSDSDDGLSD